MVRRFGWSLVVAVVALFSVIHAPVVHADATDGDIFYTVFGGTDRLFTRTYSYDGIGTITYGPQITISSNSDGLTGADGLVFDPTNTNFLIVGGQDTQQFFRVNATLAHQPVVGSALTGNGIYHLVADPSGTSVWGTNIPGPNAVNIGLTGSGFGATTIRSINGATSAITGIAFDGSGNAYYTTASSGGNGNLGLINLSTGTTTQLTAGIPAAHGIQFDPFTGNLILFGDSHISQYTTAGGLVSDRNFTGLGLQFDQGTVDGHGHLFVASNTGNTMVFLDYHTSGLVGDTTTNFINLDSADFPANLDDVAPLVGPGSRQPTVPEPASLTLFGLGSLAAGFARRRKLVNI